MPMIMMVNLKGGVAKTTNAVAIAECFASLGKKVLLIDADHQCMAGELLLGNDRMEKAEERKRTLHDLLSQMLRDDFKQDQFNAFPIPNASNIEQIRENIDCVPCSHRIDEFDENMKKARKGVGSSKDFLRKLNRWRILFSRWCNRNYDYTMIDCPPSFAIQVRFLLGSADYFIIPTIPDRLSVRGSNYLVSRLRNRGLKRIHGLGTLWSMVRGGVREHKELMDRVKNDREEFKSLPLPFQQYIPNTAAIVHSTDLQTGVSTYRKKYEQGSWRMFENLCREIEERVNRVYVG